MQEPRSISKELVDAQQARSILDYLVGFNLSPFLWKKSVTASPPGGFNRWHCA